MGYCCHPAGRHGQFVNNLQDYEIHATGASAKRLRQVQMSNPSGHRGQLFSKSQIFTFLPYVHLVGGCWGRLVIDTGSYFFSLSEPVFNSHSASHCTKISTKYYSLWYIKLIMVKYCRKSSQQWNILSDCYFYYCFSFKNQHKCFYRSW